MPGSNEYLFDLLDQEGVSFRQFPPLIYRGGLLNTCEYLFRCIPEQEDPRWLIASEYEKTRDEVGFDGINFENALLAIYLSDTPSFRNGYAAYASEENVRHLCRAIVNLRSHPIFNGMFESTRLSLPEESAVEFAITDRINLGSDKNGITGCPEALYQLRMFYKNRYIARIGFNGHIEEEGVVVSITNVQGVPNGKEFYTWMIDTYQTTPFNLLVNYLRCMCESVGQASVDLRGLKNPRNEQSRGLYNALFESEGISRYSFHR
mgnify:CR=1 FL=1